VWDQESEGKEERQEWEEGKRRTRKVLRSGKRNGRWSRKRRNVVEDEAM
jgi:hypothetical protein